jgi:hypothetical protein
MHQRKHRQAKRCAATHNRSSGTSPYTAIFLAQARTVPVPVALPGQQSPIFSGLSAIGKLEQADNACVQKLE